MTAHALIYRPTIGFLFGHPAHFVALGFGTADTSFRSPMAIAVIGGLMTSTFLSLLVVPVVFTYVDDLIGWFVALRSRKGST